jgi:hypothetical protein
MSYAQAGLLLSRKRPIATGKLANSLEQIATQVQRAGQILRDLRALR